MKKMPVVFFGHGNPMNALLKNQYTEAWKTQGATIPTPRAILMVSAHWYVPYTGVTAMKRPRTIHDFGGFPQELYQVEYPALGDPELASRVRELLSPVAVELDLSWGLDHGTWSVLCHAYPAADIPVVQLSIDESQPASFHYELAKRLKPLRKEGILIAGSGNLVHNLRAYAWGEHSVNPYDWALRFENRVCELLESGTHDPLIYYETLGSDATLSVPTPDHYLPLIYVIGARDENESITFPVRGIDGGSVSMLSFKIDK
jgi:4,5-DOPA dioxygenase extradiol